MSKIGFRTSIFGFNKDDVNMYLLKLQQEYSLKEQEFIKKISSFENEIETLKTQCNTADENLKQTTQELEKTKANYSELKQREEEIEQMSQNIGTMYMVALQNSEKMISDAEECATKINQISMERLDAAYKAEEQLNSIKEGITASAKKFNEEIVNFTNSLEEPKKHLMGKLEATNASNPEIPAELNNEND